MRTYLDFEKPIAEIEGKIADLRDVAEDGETDGVHKEIEVLEGKAKSSLEDIYKKLTPWQKTQVARHGERPHCSDLHQYARSTPSLQPADHGAVETCQESFEPSRMMDGINTKKGRTKHRCVSHFAAMTATNTAFIDRRDRIEFQWIRRCLQR